MVFRHPVLHVAIVVMLVCCTVLPWHGVDAAPPVANVSRTLEPMKLDGRANEAAWSHAAKLDGFSVYEPRSDVAPRFRSHGLILRDAEALYLFIDVIFPSTDVYAPMIRRDGSPDGDRVSVIIDSLASGQKGYMFVAGAGGYMRDSLMTISDQDVDPEWDSLFDAEPRRTENGWSVEIRIPFESLRFTQGTPEWGLHVMVEGWKHQQTLSWAPIDRDKNNLVGQAGRLRGIEDAVPGRAFELLPALTLGWGQNAASPPAACTFDAGFGQFEVCGANVATSLSGKWALSPALSLDVSIFPDFSQLGADAAQLTVNNRYALFHPERRPFFIEGKDIFDIHMETFDSNLALFYSRSIGRPEAAVKLSGSIDSTRVGAVIAWDRAPADSISDSEFSEQSLSEDERGDVRSLVSVIRGQQLLGSDGNVGVMVLDKEVFVGSERRANNQVVGRQLGCSLVARNRRIPPCRAP